MVINGAMECGSNPPNTHGSLNRQYYYQLYAAQFGVDTAGDKLDCADMSQFSPGGSANIPLYWEPQQNCQLVTWQTAFSALVDGNYRKCINSIP